MQQSASDKFIGFETARRQHLETWMQNYVQQMKSQHSVQFSFGSCWTVPNWVGWIDAEACRDTQNIHCGIPSPCGSHFLWNKAYCEEPAPGAARLKQPRTRFNVVDFDGETDNHDTYGNSRKAAMWVQKTERMVPDILRANFYRDHDPGDTDSPYGLQLYTRARAECYHPDGEMNHPEYSNCVGVNVTPCQYVKGKAGQQYPGDENLHEWDWGAKRVWLGPGPCFQDDFEHYRVKVFGRDCVYCKHFFWSVGYPCFGCAYDYYSIPSGAECVPNWCENPNACCIVSDCGGPAVDPVECEAKFSDTPVNRALGYWNPNWKLGCHYDLEDGFNNPNHCKHCGWMTVAGTLVNAILRLTNALDRIPMIPITENEDGSKLPCGQFGWQLDSSRRLDYFACNEYDLQVENESLTISAITPCGPVSGYTCPPSNYHCVPHLFAAWYARSSSNRIQSAKILFKQRELCDPANGPFSPPEYGCGSAPCASTPIGCGPDQYINPSSEIVLDMEAKITITIVLARHDRSGVNNCCLDSKSTPIEIWPVTVTLESNTTVLMGDHGGGWGGYNVGDDPRRGIDYGVQSGWGHPCSGTDPASSAPRNMCMSLFSNQGRWTDFDCHSCGLPTETIQWFPPPKQCPDFVVRDPEGPYPRDQFFCPPLMRAKWSIGSKTSFVPQCWDAEALNNVQDCVDDHTGLQYACTKPECRRGCWLGNPFREFCGSSFCWDRTNPCHPNLPLGCMGQSVPWSCMHCVI